MIDDYLLSTFTPGVECNFTAVGRSDAFVFFISINTQYDLNVIHHYGNNPLHEKGTDLAGFLKAGVSFGFFFKRGVYRNMAWLRDYDGNPHADDEVPVTEKPRGRTDGTRHF
jgi:hypothetical protein